MKKYWLLSLYILFFTSPLYAFNTAVMSGGGVSAGGVPAYSFRIEFDNDTDWSNGYTTGGNDYPTGLAGTVSNATRDTTNYVSAGQSLSLDAGGERITFANNGKWDSTDGCIQFMGRIGTDYETATEDILFEAYHDASNHFIIATSGGTATSEALIRVKHVGNGNDVKGRTTVHLDADDFGMVQVCHDVAGGFSGGAELKYRVCIDDVCDSESWEYESDADNTVAFTSEPTNYHLGENVAGSIANVINVDNFYIYNSPTVLD